MGRNGLLIGEVASRSGVSRKALRLYEETGILPAPGRTEAGYRIYGPETLPLLAVITQARQPVHLPQSSPARVEEEEYLACAWDLDFFVVLLLVGDRSSFILVRAVRGGS
jgi:hypothetical protein